MASAIGRRLSLRAARRTGNAIGSLAWFVAPRDRRRALDHLAIAFPEKSETERRRIAKAMFRHLGITLFELLWLPNLDVAAIAKTTVVEGLDRVKDLVAAGRTVVAFTGHLGNWEWLGAAIALGGLPVTALQRERDDPAANELITRLRSRAGIRTIDRGSSASSREMIGAFRSPGVVAFLIDQAIRTESAPVPFFGRPALTAIGPARLAIRTEAAVVCVFIERRADGMHHVRFGEPIETRRGDDPVALVAKVTAEIEQQIRRVPEQWVWMHERWKYRERWDVTKQPS